MLPTDMKTFGSAEAIGLLWVVPASSVLVVFAAAGVEFTAVTPDRAARAAARLRIFGSLFAILRLPNIQLASIQSMVEFVHRVGNATRNARLSSGSDGANPTQPPGICRRPG